MVAIFLAIEQLEGWYGGKVARALTDVGVATVTNTALLASGASPPLAGDLWRLCVPDLRCDLVLR